MKKLIIITFTGLALFVTGCLKDTPGTDLLTAGGNILEMLYPAGGQNNAIGSGIEFFGGGALTFPGTDVSDTVTFYVNIAGTNTLSKSLSVTIGVDQTHAQDNYSTDSLTYIPFPDSTYSILSSTQTIPAGSRMDTFKIVFYPDKFDPTQNYALPVVISSNSQSLPVSANFGTIYLHTIGNPIAGAYNWDFIRYNATDSTGTPTSQSFYDNSAVFAPDNGTQVEVPSGYAYNPRYVITFTNTSGVLSDFAVSLNKADIATLKSNGITVTKPPQIIVADPIHGYYRFYYIVQNSSGSRYLIDSYYK